MYIWIIGICSGCFITYIIYNINALFFLYNRANAYITIQGRKYIKNSDTTPRLRYFSDNKLNINTKHITSTQQPANNISLVSVNNKDSTYDISNIKFILFEVRLKTKNSVPYNINLYSANDKYTFYIVDNILNYQFIVWFLKNIHNKDISIKDIQSVAILDHNCCPVQLNINDSIIIKKQSYIYN